MRNKAQGNVQCVGGLKLSGDNTECQPRYFYELYEANANTCAGTEDKVYEAIWLLPAGEGSTTGCRCQPNSEDRCYIGSLDPSVSGSTTCIWTSQWPVDFGSGETPAPSATPAP